MGEKVTDYTPGDDPVPVGTVVDYFGSLAHGLYEITEHRSAEEYPKHLSVDADLFVPYPDGIGYRLWPLDMPKKMGNEPYSVNFARRTSFRRLHEEQKGN
jgi:hypothetical protein